MPKHVLNVGVNADDHTRVQKYFDESYEEYRAWQCRYFVQYTLSILDLLWITNFFLIPSIFLRNNLNQVHPHLEDIVLSVAEEEGDPHEEPLEDLP